MKYKDEMALAIDAAKVAGEYLESVKTVYVDSSICKDIKLESDKKSESLILDVLHPSGIPILTEETGLHIGTLGECELRWIVDPLDGSANLWKGVKEMTAVSIALWRGNEPLLGVVNRYHMNELFFGVVGEGAWMNGDSISTSNISTMREAVFATGFPVKRDYDKDSLERFIRQIQHFKKIRMLGTATLMGTFVSCGRFDAYCEEDIMLWDIAAATALVLSAGGFADLKMRENNKCVCSLFATEELYEEFMNA